MTENSSKYMKRLHNVAEFRRIIYDAFTNLGDMRAAKGSVVTKEFGERIMLAVTEVNGCRYCNYFHSRQALEAGVSAQEIKQLANGEFDDVPPKQLPALLFAQHYAESVGLPESQMVSQFYETYGPVESRAILAYIRMIMIGNSYGNAFDAFRHRLKSKPVAVSRLRDELGVLLGAFFFFPEMLLRGIFTR